jgi:hypothetical protein
MAMFGNGVQTGLPVSLKPLKPILQDLQQATHALFVVEPGSAMPCIADQPFAPATPRTAISTISGFACLSPPSFEEIKGYYKIDYLILLFEN